MTAYRNVPVLAVMQSLRLLLRRVEADGSELEHSHGVTAPQLACLRVIAASGHLNQTDLARMVHISASTLVGVIDRLELKGLVHRERDRVDRRRVSLTSTHAGRALAASAPDTLQQHLGRVMSRMPAEQQEAIAAALDQLVHLLAAECAGEEPVLTGSTLADPQPSLAPEPGPA